MIKLPQKYQPLTQAKVIPIYPQKNIFVCRKLKDSGEITDEMRRVIESGEDLAREKFNKTYSVTKFDVVNRNIILMNRDIQRRYIMERMEKNNEENNENENQA